MRVAPASGSRVALRDGRVLGYASFGPRSGVPVLYFHGLAGSPLAESAVSEAVLKRGGVRWVCVQRPGFGLSDTRPGRRIRDWPIDLLELLDALEIERAHIIGISAGAPYAFAAAGALRERISSLGVVSGLGPPGRDGRRLARQLVRLPLGYRCGGGDRVLPDLRRSPRAARAVAAAAGAGRPQGSRDAVIAALLTSAQRGARPIADELRLVLSPWGIELGAVRCPATLFHGVRDRLVPVEDAARLARTLADATLRTYSDEGHFFFRRRIGEILATVLSCDRGQLAAESRPAVEPTPTLTSASTERLDGALATH